MRDEIARLRFERNRFANLAAERRREAIACRKARKWLAALNHDGRASEYRQTRDDFAAKIKQMIANESAKP